MIKGTEMLYLYEVEIFKDGDFYIAVPFDFGGATEGFSKMECLEMASDLLTTEIQDQLMHGEELTEPTIDNEPQYGGKIYSFVIDTSLNSIPRMLKAEAARELGISQGRVSQLIRAGKLETLFSSRFGFNFWHLLLEFYVDISTFLFNSEFRIQNYFFFGSGAKNIVIRLPSSLGICSTLP